LEYSETFKEIRTFCDQKPEKVCHVVSLLIGCEALMSTLDFVPQVLSPSIVKLLSISTGKKEKFLYRERQAIEDYPDQTYSHFFRKPFTKYLEEASYIKKLLREDLNIQENPMYIPFTIIMITHKNSFQHQVLQTFRYH
jgi:hypothetical protein